MARVSGYQESPLIDISFKFEGTDILVSSWLDYMRSIEVLASALAVKEILAEPQLHGQVLESFPPYVRDGQLLLTKFDGFEIESGSILLKFKGRGPGSFSEAMLAACVASAITLSLAIPVSDPASYSLSQFLRHSSQVTGLIEASQERALTLMQSGSVAASAAVDRVSHFVVFEGEPKLTINLKSEIKPIELALSAVVGYLATRLRKRRRDTESQSPAHPATDSTVSPHSSESKPQQAIPLPAGPDPFIDAELEALEKKLNRP